MKIITSILLFFSTVSNIQAVQDSLIINLGQDTSICQGDSLMLDIGITGDSLLYLWSTGDSTQQITVKNEGVYVVTVFNNFVSCSDTIFITEIPKPNVELLVDTVCFSAFSTFTATTQNLPEATYSWDFGDNTQIDSTTNTIAHLYNTNGGSFLATLSIDNQNGCTASSSVETIIKPSPIASLTTDSACINQNIIIANQSTNVDTTSLYQIDFGDFNSGILIDFTTIEYLYDSAGTYDIKLFVENENGCQDSSTVTTETHPNPQPTILGLENEYCINVGRDTLRGLPEGGIFTGRYISNQENFGLFEPLEIDSNIIVTYTYTSEFGCINTDSQTVTAVRPLPSASLIGLSKTYCANAPIDTLVGQPLGGIFDGKFISQDGRNGLFSPTLPDSSILITYLFEDEFGCIDTDSQIVDWVYPIPEVNFSGLTDYCLGDPIDTLIGNQNGGIFIGDFIIPISSDSNSISIVNPLEVGDFLITYSSTNGFQCTNFITENYTVFPLPVVDLGNDTAILSGQIIVLSNRVQESDYEYLWSNGQIKPTLEITNPGFYTLDIISNISGCSAADTILVDFANPTINFSTASSLNIYPNPFFDVINLEFTNYPKPNANIQLFDAVGRLVKKYSIEIFGNKDLKKLDLDNLNKGIHFLKIEHYFIKIIKI